MRTLKFRLWDKKFKSYIPQPMVLFSNLYQDSENYLVEQYVGKKDSLGAEIFEGDIIETTDRETVGMGEQGEPIFETISRTGFVFHNDREVHFAIEYYLWLKTCAGQEDGEPVRGGIWRPFSGYSLRVIGNVNINSEMHNDFLAKRVAVKDDVLKKSAHYNPKGYKQAQGRKADSNQDEDII